MLLTWVGFSFCRLIWTFSHVCTAASSLFPAPLDGFLGVFLWSTSSRMWSKVERCLLILPSLGVNVDFYLLFKFKPTQVLLSCLTPSSATARATLSSSTRWSGSWSRRRTSWSCACSTGTSCRARVFGPSPVNSSRGGDNFGLWWI